jgi:hypothetical protein
LHRSGRQPSDSHLFGLNYLTGVANPNNPAFSNYSNWYDVGAGLGASASVHTDTSSTSDNGEVTVVVQTSVGKLVTVNASVSGSVNPGEVDWRQTHPETGP